MNERGLKFKDASCQLSPLRMALLSPSPGLASVESRLKMRWGMSSGVGACARAARRVRSRGLRFAFGKKEIEAEDEHERREIPEDLRRSSSSLCCAASLP